MNPSTDIHPQLFIHRSKRLGVQTFRRENDRFWILAAHPEQNLLVRWYCVSAVYGDATPLLTTVQPTTQPPPTRRRPATTRA